MKNMIKLKPAEYRVRYTNEFFTKKDDYTFLAEEGITRKLNEILSIFADNIFIGYNVPVEIPITKTDIIFRYMVDFLLCDHNGDVIAVEIEDLSNLSNFSQRMQLWPHYYTPYSFLADTFDKNIFLCLIDPATFMKMEYQFMAKSVNEDLAELKCLTKNMSNEYYTPNLFACRECVYLGGCNE